MKTFVLADLGEGLQDAEIVSWYVTAGDRVVADQPLLAVETEKAVVEVPAPWSGIVLKLYAAPGDVVATGAPLADFDLDSALHDAGAVVGELPKAAAATIAQNKKTTPPDQGRIARTMAAPAVRQLAAELGVDLSTLKGSGPGGAVTKSDVTSAGAAGADDSWQPLRGVRRVMARNMSQAHVEVAATTVTETADVTHWPGSEHVTLRLVQAVVAACRLEPALNAWFDSRKNARLVHK
ncbi:MAG TPA: biotin/lipoyl-containing protein, partial [Hyphomicrobiaceae bacterium]|nr:biotin/lipoyl-containing protein [Hyphomicrobiaceae bacterium]